MASLAESLETGNYTNSTSFKWQKGAYRREINGLRAIAVIAAGIHNFGEHILPCGYLGVDIFSVISGYVITASIWGRSYKSSKEFIGTFFKKRALRLLPGLVTMVSFFSIFLATILPIDTIRTQLRTGIAALAGVSNLWLVKESTDYFNIDAKLNPFTATWSLSSEEQYYLIFPFLLLICGLTTQKHNSIRNLISLIAGTTIFSFILFSYFWTENQTIAYFMMPTRFWEMGLGCIGCIIYETRLRSRKILDTSILLFPLLLLTFFAPIEFNFIATILSCIFTIGIILTVQPQSKVSGFLNNPISDYLARISYALYLWRWPTISAVFLLFGQLDHITIFIATIFLLLIATLSTFCIEEPIRNQKLQASFLKPKGIVIAYIASFVSLATWIPARIANIASSLDLNLYTKDELRIVHSEMQCDLATDSQSAIQCLSRKDNDPAIFVVGSSHATNLVPSIQKALRSNSRRIYYSQHIVKHYDSIRESLEKDVQKGDIVIYSRNQDSFYTTNLYGGPFPVSNEKILELKMHIKFLQFLTEERGANLVLVNDVPSFSFAEWIPSPLKGSDPGISLNEAIRRRKPYSERLREFADSHDTVILDPFPILCDTNWCPIKQDGHMIYGDHSPHISIKHSTILLPLFKTINDY